MKDKKITLKIAAPKVRGAPVRPAIRLDSVKKYKRKKLDKEEE